MCQQYARATSAQRIAQMFGFLPDEQETACLAPDPHVSPRSAQPVIRLKKESLKPEVVRMHWGLHPHYSHANANTMRSTPTIARADKLTEKGIWELPFRKRRCLVPATGFYASTKAKRVSVRDLQFTMHDHAPFAFAGLWDAWCDPATGAWFQGFAIITTAANLMVSKIQSRMPVILKPQHFDEWLRRDNSLPQVPLLPFAGQNLVLSAPDQSAANLLSDSLVPRERTTRVGRVRRERQPQYLKHQG